MKHNQVVIMGKAGSFRLHTHFGRPVLGRQHIRHRRAPVMPIACTRTFHIIWCPSTNKRTRMLVRWASWYEIGRGVETRIAYIRRPLGRRRHLIHLHMFRNLAVDLLRETFFGSSSPCTPYIFYYFCFYTCRSLLYFRAMYSSSSPSSIQLIYLSMALSVSLNHDR